MHMIKSGDYIQNYIVCVITRDCKISERKYYKGHLAKIEGSRPNSIDLDIKNTGFAALAFKHCEGSPRLRLAYRNEEIKWDINL